MDSFYAEGEVIEVRAPGQYGQEIMIDIGTVEKSNNVMFEAYVDKNTGKSFLPHGIAKGWHVKFKFKPRTVTGTSKTTGREYCITKIGIRDVERIEGALGGVEAAARQANAQAAISQPSLADTDDGGDPLPF